MKKKQKRNLVRIIIAGVLLIGLKVALHYTETNQLNILFLSLFAITFLIIGLDILKKAFKGLINGQILDENFLMAIATVGAIGLALYEKSCDLSEAVAVMLFYQIGEFFQSYAVEKSRKNITSLMDIRPDYANIEKNGELIKVDPNQVELNSVIVVQPGEKVPLDGVVIEGVSSLDTSSLTGESLPREVSQGSDVISGSINLSGLLKVRTTKVFGESTVSKILSIVESSSSRKSKSENFISKFARVYTPIVCASALALAVMVPIINLISGKGGQWEVWIYRALTFLVISCPCALVISIPLSFFAGIGGASKNGILIKGSNYLETLSKVKTVVFDKTGTLTKGVFEVVAVHHNKIDEAKLIEFAALAECSSSHPISISLQKAYGKRIDRNRVTDVSEHAGFGLSAVVDGKTVSCGSYKLMEKLGVEYRQCHSVGTIIHVAIDGQYAGHIVISDVVKPQSAKAIEMLKKLGIKKTVMLTGDSELVAQDVGSSLNLDEVHSSLMPSDKVEWVEKLLSENGPKDKLAFVGDGINDAPVLGRSDIGLAMGAMGSDAAIESADVVLMDDDPTKIPLAIRISRKCLRIVYENIGFALIIKLLCLVLGAVGIANMWLAIFADVGVMVIAVLNAIRALRI